MNTKQEKTLPVKARVKLMLCTDDRFFGPGVCELLEKIRETGSIQAAAARMELSYTKAWKILNRAEQELGKNLIKSWNLRKHFLQPQTLRTAMSYVHQSFRPSLDRRKQILLGY